MMKKILAAALTLLLLCSCGGGNTEAKDPFTVDLADQLLASGAFEGSDMAPLDATLIALLYGIEESSITDCVGYMAANTSASYDELVILILTDEETAVAVEDACRQRIVSQIASAEGYCPAAVPRLEGAVLQRRGNTVLLAAGDPDILFSLDVLK